MACTCRGVRSVTVLLLVLSGCGGSKVLDEPVTLELEAPLSVVADERIELCLDWVVVRDGPGSWVRSANWDQYLLRIGNLSPDRIRIVRAVLYDSQGMPLAPSAVPEALIRESRAASRRYRDAGLRVQAGIGGKGMLAAGYVAGTAGTAVSYSLFWGGAAPAASGFAIGALAAGAVLTVGGVVQSYREDRIARAMIERHTPLPYDIDPGTLQSISWFFPLAPSPSRLEVYYLDRTGEHRLVLDTREALEGLHIGDIDETQRD